VVLGVVDSSLLEEDIHIAVVAAGVDMGTRMVAAAAHKVVVHTVEPLDHMTWFPRRNLWHVNGHDPTKLVMLIPWLWLSSFPSLPSFPSFSFFLSLSFSFSFSLSLSSAKRFLNSFVMSLVSFSKKDMVKCSGISRYRGG